MLALLLSMVLVATESMSSSFNDEFDDRGGWRYDSGGKVSGSRK